MMLNIQKLKGIYKCTIWHAILFTMRVLACCSHPGLVVCVCFLDSTREQAHVPLGLNKA